MSLKLNAIIISVHITMLNSMTWNVQNVDCFYCAFQFLDKRFFLYDEEFSDDEKYSKL